MAHLHIVRRARPVTVISGPPPAPLDLARDSGPRYGRCVVCDQREANGLHSGHEVCSHCARAIDADLDAIRTWREEEITLARASIARAVISLVSAGGMGEHVARLREILSRLG